MTLKQLSKHFKNRAEIARALGISPQAVQQWFEAGKIPHTRQFQIQIVTEGKLKAAAPACSKAA